MTPRRQRIRAKYGTWRDLEAKYTRRLMQALGLMLAALLLAELLRH